MQFLIRQHLLFLVAISFRGTSDYPLSEYQLRNGLDALCGLIKVCDEYGLVIETNESLAMLTMLDFEDVFFFFSEKQKAEVAHLFNEFKATKDNKYPKLKSLALAAQSASNLMEIDPFIHLRLNVEASPEQIKRIRKDLEKYAIGFTGNRLEKAGHTYYSIGHLEAQVSETLKNKERVYGKYFDLVADDLVGSNEIRKEEIPLLEILLSLWQAKSIEIKDVRVVGKAVTASVGILAHDGHSAAEHIAPSKLPKIKKERGQLIVTFDDGEVNFGGTNTLPCRFVEKVIKSKLAPFSVDAIFRELASENNKRDALYLNPTTRQAFQIKTIKEWIRSLQRGRKLDGRMTFRIEGEPPVLITKI